MEIEDGHLRGAFFLSCLITAVDKNGESLIFCGLGHLLSDTVLKVWRHNYNRLPPLLFAISAFISGLAQVPAPTPWHEMSCHQFLPLEARIPRERECTSLRPHREIDQHQI